MTNGWGGNKVGRNEPCPCGSGAKFKRCHGKLDVQDRIATTAREVAQVRDRVQAQELLRQHQQGKGKEIISAEVAGRRVVAVGNKIYFAKNGKTFIDFLTGYLAAVMGKEWGDAELKKRREEQHQIAQWYVDYCHHQQKHMTKPAGEIQDCPLNGLVYAYLGLAYNLYLLDHNAELQAYLVRRLRHRNSFYGAYYETHVAAWFILAGFTLAIENEQDSTRTHPEFVATRNGKSYSIEAKTRQPEKSDLNVGNQLAAALKKQASHPRMVFIDMNVGADVDFDRVAREVTAAVKGQEPKLTIDRQPAPPAYVLITNEPSHLALDREQIPRLFLCIGFKIPDFGHGVKFSSFVEAHRVREKHADAYSIFDAFSNYRVPVTYDGELPAFAYGKAERRFVIGERYQIADGVLATLTTAFVAENEKKVYLAFHTDDDKAPMLTADLSDDELAAYKEHPQTFFGKITKPQRTSKTPMEMFDFFREGYKNTPRERMLEFFANSSDLEELKKLSVEDLRLVYAERCTYAVMQQSGKPVRNKESAS